jgi:hypothetical protein
MKLTSWLTNRKLAVAALISMLLVAGCQATPTAAVATLAATQANGSGYPGTTDTPQPAISYPSNLTTPDNSATAMTIDQPVKAGATVVTGHAPAGVVVAIDNVTLMGDELGSAVAGPDGRYSVTVPALEASVRLGLFVKDVGSSGKTIEDFNGAQYQGSGAMMVPQVGYYVDTASVQP